ncbi:MAG: hypothetical protein ACLFU7_11545 [Armatimonadota bacterium]
MTHRRNDEDSTTGADPDSETVSDERAGEGRHGDDSAEHLRCPTCGSKVPEGGRSCPVCRRGMYRTCFCGWQLPVTEAECSNCGADWSQSARVARKSKSRSRRTRDAVRYALAGAVAAVVTALVLHLMLRGFASLALEGQAAPRGIGEQVRLALSGIAKLMEQAWAAVVNYGATVVLVVGIMAVGAAAGMAVYVVRTGILSRQKRSSSRRVRRKRRK